VSLLPLLSAALRCPREKGNSKESQRPKLRFFRREKDPSTPVGRRQGKKTQTSPEEKSKKAWGGLEWELVLEP